MTWVSFGFNFLKRHIFVDFIVLYSTLFLLLFLKILLCRRMLDRFRNCYDFDKKGSNPGVSCIEQCKCKHSLCLQDRIYVMRNRLSKIPVMKHFLDCTWLLGISSHLEKNCQFYVPLTPLMREPFRISWHTGRNNFEVHYHQREYWMIYRVAGFLAVV